MTDKTEILAHFNERLEDAKSALQEWRETECKESFAFVAGHQWAEEAVNSLKAQNRPVITFNDISPFIRSIEGYIIQTRREPKFLPRTIEDQGINDLANSFVKWMRDEANSQFVESAAGRDTIICGVGVMNNRISFEKNPDGEFVKEHINPLEMYWDPLASDKNLGDAKWLIRSKEFTKLDLINEFGEEEGGKAWLLATSDQQAIANSNADTGKYYNLDNVTNTNQGAIKTVTVYEYQFYEKEVYWRIANPLFSEEIQEQFGFDLDSAKQVITAYEAWLNDKKNQQLFQQFLLLLNQFPGMGVVSLLIATSDDGDFNLKDPTFSLEPSDYKTFKEQLKGLDIAIEAAKLKRRCYKRAFLTTDMVIEFSENTIKDDFTYDFITGEYDEISKCFHGFVRSMKDPAMYKNQAFSSLLHAIKANPRGGAYVEESAVDNIAEFERKFAKLDSVLTVKDGALTSGRIQPKATAALPTGYEQIYGIAKQAQTDVTGVSQAFLGQEGTFQQSGILNQQRTQAGALAIVPYLDAFTLYTKTNGKKLLSFMRMLVDNVEGRIFRVTGEEGNRYEQIFKDQLFADYDVVVDEAPISPNQEAENRQAILTLAQTGLFSMDMLGIQMLRMMFIENSGMPEAFKNKLRQMMNEAQQVDPQEQQLQQQKQMLLMQEQQLKNRETAANTEYKQAQTQETKAQIQETLSETQKNLAAIKTSETQALKQQVELAQGLFGNSRFI